MDAISKLTMQIQPMQNQLIHPFSENQTTDNNVASRSFSNIFQELISSNDLNKSQSQSTSTAVAALVLNGNSAASVLAKEGLTLLTSPNLSKEIFETFSEAEITPPNGLLLVENPNLLMQTGNSEADELVNIVLSLRLGRGLQTDADTRAVSTAQASLLALGYDIGEYGPFLGGVDGILGPRTSSGITQFQRDHGLETTGTLSAETAELLLKTAKPALDSISEDWANRLRGSELSSTAHMGTANPFWYIRFVAQAGDDPTTMGNIDAVFKGRLAALARDAGKAAEFGEGYRNFERQAWFYEQYRNGTGALAARPGQSRHNSGLAVDTQSEWLLRIGEGMPADRQTVLLEYGLVKPMADGEGRGREPWHIEPVEARSGS